MRGAEAYFRLHFLRVKDHPVFKDLDVEFSQRADTFSDGSSFFTLVIGPNGTGKSRLLRYLIDIFRVAFEKKEQIKKVNYPQGKYFLEYRFNQHTYQILNSLPLREENPKIIDQQGELRFFQDGLEISPSGLILPVAIIAISSIITDKFIAAPSNLRKVEKEPEADFFKFYNYMGVRYRGNTAGTRVLIRKTTERIYKAIGKTEFIPRLRKVLEFLHLRQELKIFYALRYSSYLFNPLKKLDKSALEDFFDHYQDRSKRATKPWGFDRFDKIRKETPEKIHHLVDAINDIASLTFIQGDGGPFEINIFAMTPKILKLLPYLEELHELDLISFPQLRIFKKDIDYYLEEGSSGEINAFAGLIALFSTIDSGSLILMDEPETSLHPNWQMQYVGLLNSLLPDLYSAHFILCSHSHFLASDLPSHKSQIISMKNTDGITAEALTQNTFGWSAEQILLEVFNTPTTRNYFVAEKIGMILDLISRPAVSRNVDLIRSEVKELRKLNLQNLPESDPLADVVKRIMETYGQN